MTVSAVPHSSSLVCGSGASSKPVQAARVQIVTAANAAFAVCKLQYVVVFYCAMLAVLVLPSQALIPMWTF